MSVASKNANASSIAVLCVAARGTSVGQTGTTAFPAGVHSARKSVPPDARQHGQLGSGNERRRDLAVGCGRSDLVSVAQNDRDWSSEALETIGIEALDDGRSHHEGCFDSGYAEIVLRVSELRSAGGLGEERFRVRARELKLFLRGAHPVFRMRVAELQKVVEIHTRAGFDEAREAAGRETSGAEPIEIEMGADQSDRLFALSSAVARSPGRSQERTASPPTVMGSRPLLPG